MKLTGSMRSQDSINKVGHRKEKIKENCQELFILLLYMFLASCFLQIDFDDFGRVIFGLYRGNDSPDGLAGHSAGIGSLFLFFLFLLLFFLFQRYVLCAFVSDSFPLICLWYFIYRKVYWLFYSGSLCVSLFSWWRHRLLRYCSRCTARRHSNPIPLYQLSRLRA